jgi:hypothetical protein
MKFAKNTQIIYNFENFLRFLVYSTIFHTFCTTKIFGQSFKWYKSQTYHL